MKKLMIIVVIIACSISATAHANLRDEQRRAREQAAINATAAQAITTISPAVFQKVEKLMEKKGFKKIGTWVASSRGFMIRINSEEDYHYVIIQWNGNVVHWIVDSWTGDTTKPLWDWETIK